MPVIRIMLAAFLLALTRGVAPAEEPAPTVPPAAEAIMARVAANQDAAEEERNHYVYTQHARILSRKGTTVMCEEVTESRVTPTEHGSRQDLLSLKGRFLREHEFVKYTTPLAREDTKNPADEDDDSLSIEIGNDDRALVENMRSSLIDTRSKDGLGAHLFPLTSKSQGDSIFHLIGREHVNGREVFHLEFRPKERRLYRCGCLPAGGRQHIHGAKSPFRGAHPAGHESSGPGLHRGLCATAGRSMVSGEFRDRVQNSRSVLL
jgi:hypothetical protein